MSFSWTLLLLSWATVLAPSAVCVDYGAQSLLNPIRFFNYVTCKGRRVTAGVMGNFTVTSRLNCVRECTNHALCRSCTYCSVGRSKTCVLSSDHQLSCAALTAMDSHCWVSELSAQVCQNGGQFNKVTMVCDCLFGWAGIACESPSFTFGPFPETATTAPPLQTATTQYPPTTTKSGCSGLLSCAGDLVGGLLGR